MTICVVLVASVDSQLEQEILDAGSEYQHLAGLPKALLPVSGGKRVLDYWWTAIESQRQISDVYLVTNAKSFKHFERWATARGLPSQNVVNDGTTTRASSLGAKLMPSGRSRAASYTQPSLSLSPEAPRRSYSARLSAAAASPASAGGAIASAGSALLQGLRGGVKALPRAGRRSRGS